MSVWRTRKKGTDNQRGQRFPITPHGDKDSLPTGLKQVTASEPLRIMESEAQTKEELDSLQSQIEHAIQMEEYAKAKEMASRYQKLKAILEQPETTGLSTKDKLKIALKKIGDRVAELEEMGREWEESLEQT